MYGQRIALCEFPLLHRPLRRWDLCCLIGEGHEMAFTSLRCIPHRQAQTPGPREYHCVMR
jgi:hypothetical protein